ncbi:MAG: signal peptidase I [Parachlamydiales bacterium]|nr:signal peptidase I [Parachlamydiales bacterium]
MRTSKPLKKIKKELHSLYYYYKRKRETLSEETQKSFEMLLLSAQEAITQKDLLALQEYMQELEKLQKVHLPKKKFYRYLESFLGLIFFIIVIILIRQMWFENYNIPSGSMRPTFRENDFLIVSKTPFNINTPTVLGHYYFDDSLLNRGDTVIFSASGLDFVDTDTKYLWIIPGKKQFIKRLIAKPGDTIYFYGKKMYGIDAAGNEILEFSTDPWFKSIAHIPFIRFEGRTKYLEKSLPNVVSSVMIYQMNQPLAQISILPSGKVEGTLLQKNELLPVHDFGEFWGINNYGMSRILTKQLAQIYNPEPMPEADYYLEITHHPSIRPPQASTTFYAKKYFSFVQPELRTSRSYLPLDQKHLEKILHHMTTSRFYVKEGFAFVRNEKQTNLPYFKNVPNGCYEFIQGKAYQVFFGGILKQLSPLHPLYNTNPEQIILLYNLGIEFSTYYAPNDSDTSLHPSRYAYYDYGDLCLMDASIFTREDPVLIDFIQREHEKASSQLLNIPYFPFDDAGAPVDTNGKINKDFIRQYGLIVPQDRYLVLGDNYAVSADSREFGFVPQENLRGKASFIIWPFGPRFGRIFQPSTPWITFPHCSVWGIALIAIVGSIFYNRRRNKSKFQF